MNRLIMAAALVCWIASPALAKSRFTTLWERRFGGVTRQLFGGMTVLTDGSVMIAGTTYPKGGKSGARVLRLDASGRVLWDRTFGGPRDDWVIDIAGLPGGGATVVGTTSSSGSDYATWVLRLDAAGHLLWERTFTDNQVATGVIALSDGGVVVGGFNWSEGRVLEAEAYEPWLMRLDSSGKLVWERRSYASFARLIVTPSRATDQAMAPLPEGNFLVAGTTQIKGSGERNVRVVKLDGAGRVIWNRTFGGSENATAYNIVALPDGGALIVGDTKSKGSGEGQIWLLRLDPEGNVLWDRTPGKTAWVPFSSLVQELSAARLPDGGFVVARSQTQSRNWLLRLGPDGSLLWDRTFGDDEMRSIATLHDGSIIVGGQTGYLRGHEYNSDDLWVLRLQESDAPAAAASPREAKDAGYWLGRGYDSYKARELDKAIDHLKRATEIDPRFSLAHSLLGETYYAKGLYKEAVESYHRVITLGVADENIYLRRGIANRESGNLDSAIEDFERAIEINPRKTSSYHNLGRTYFRKRVYGKAVENFKKVFQHLGGSPRWYDHYWLGMTYYHLAEYGKAVEALEKADALDPQGRQVPDAFHVTAKNWNLYLTLGHAYLKLGRRQEAAAAYRLYTPDGRGGYLRLSGQSSWNTGDYEEAFPYIRAAALVNPINFSLFSSLSEFTGYSKSYDYTSAIQYFKNAAQQNPNDVDYRIALASLYFLSKQYRNAIETALDVVRLDFRSAPAFELLAKSFFGLREYSGVISAYERLEELNPEYSKRHKEHYELSISYAVRGDFGRAVALLEEGQSKYSSGSDIHRILYEWQVVAAYGASGLEGAGKIWKKEHHNLPRDFLSMDSYRAQMADLIYGGLWDLAPAAEQNHILYAALQHYSLAYRLISEVVRYGTAWADKQLEELRGKIFAIYKRLPLKPIPTGPAQDHIIQAQRYLDQERWREARENYDKALKIAPWWAEGYFNRALLTATMWSISPATVHDMQAYLELEPNGEHAANARDKLHKWEKYIEELTRKGVRFGVHPSPIAPDKR